MSAMFSGVPAAALQPEAPHGKFGGCDFSYPYRYGPIEYYGQDLIDIVSKHLS